MTSATQRIEAQTSIPHIVLTAIARKGLTALATVLATRGISPATRPSRSSASPSAWRYWRQMSRSGRSRRNLRALALDPSATQVVPK